MNGGERGEASSASGERRDTHTGGWPGDAASAKRGDTGRGEAGGGETGGGETGRREARRARQRDQQSYVCNREVQYSTRYGTRTHDLKKIAQPNPTCSITKDKKCLHLAELHPQGQARTLTDS